MPSFKYQSPEQLQVEIKKLLLDESTSQRVLADRLGIKPQGLTKLLNKKNFSFDDALKILSALGYDLVIGFEKSAK